MPSSASAPAPRPRDVVARPLTDLARELGATVDGDLSALVTGVTHDSRAVRPGDLYAALPGSRAHGAEFAAQAAAAGAVAALTDEAGRERCRAAGLPAVVVPSPRSVLGAAARWAYGAPADAMLVLGVTGTNGKTTTAYLLDAGLRGAGHRTGLVGTVETRIAGETVRSVRTTPEATDLQALFGAMREHGVDAVAMEVSSHALAMGRVDGTHYDVAIFTNLSQDHLDFHADMAEYFAAKARLFTPALSDAAVVNIDDAYGRRLAGRRGIPVTTFSAAGDPSADWRAVDVTTGPDGSRFRLVGPGVEVDAGTRLLAPFNVANALGALVALATAGVPLAAAVAGVGELTGVPGRLERVEAGQPYLALVDYAHTPDAVRTLLAELRPLTAGRLIVVLGCGGDRDRGKRPLMAAEAARGADVAVLTSDNPRSEDPQAILAAMVGGLDDVPAAERAEVVVEADRRAAIAVAVARAGAGDTVVVAGKGHEQGQEYADRTVPFDDRRVLQEVLGGAGSAA